MGKNEKNELKELSNISYQNTPPFFYGYPCEEDEIDLYELWLILKKRFKWLAGTLLVFILGTLIYLFITPPIYRTQAVIYPLSFKTSAITTSLTQSILTSVTFADVKDVLNSFELKKRIIEKLNLMPLLFPSQWDEERKRWKNPKEAPTILQGVEKLSELIAVSSKRNSQVLTLSVEFPSKPEMAYLIAKTALQEARRTTTELNLSVLKQYESFIRKKIQSVKEQLRQLANNPEGKNNPELEILKSHLAQLHQLYETTKLLEIKAKTPFQVISPPYVPDKREPYKPKKLLILSVAIVSGLFLGVFLAFFVEWLDSVRNRKDETYS